MQPGRRRWVVRTTMWVLTVGGILAALLTSASSDLTRFRRGGRRHNSVRSTAVRRVEWLTASVTAAGRAASMNNTEIRCRLARLTSPGGGGAVSTNGASTILSLIPDGSLVKKGDVLCELDASEYVELVRRQLIGVKKAEAEHLQAQLSLQIANINLKSYLEGTTKQAEQEFKGQVALTSSSLSRQNDRLAWSLRMLEKGYVSLSQVTGEREALMRLELSLEQCRMTYDNYLKFRVPRDTRALLSQVEGAKATLSFQGTRLKLEQDRLALFEDQVENCTIRAPNDGFVIYANEPGKPEQVWEGASVRQRQRLFYLPDLTRMEVQAMIHETVVNQVEIGMPAHIRFEALSGRSALGRVTSIAQLPLVDQSSGATGVKYYLATVQLEQTPSGLRPGMSAELEIVTARLPKALVLPPVAIAVEEGREVCYVMEGERIERREVKVGQRNADWMQVVEGLQEGEAVVLEPVSGIPARL